MEQTTLMGALLLWAVASPGVVFLGLSLMWLLGWQWTELALRRITVVTYAGAALCLSVLAWKMHAAGLPSFSAELGTWFVVADYRFPLSLLVDRLSLPLSGLTIVLVGIVASFSFRYLHRDGSYFRFFVLLHLFAFGSLLVFTAGSIDLLVAGWELVGITSVLLVAFFQERREPVRNAIRVFATYRVCDLGLLVGVFVLHHLTGSATCLALFQGEWPAQATSLGGGGATLVGLLLLLAASGKSAQVPFSGWLPRAMEGPTPSSAIFYGAISVHAGAYLLLRAAPILAASPVASAAVVLVGLLSALHGTFVHRTCTDAKTSLAYASMTQLGVIFVEIGLGLPQLALLHILGHAVVRTLQFLRAPSMLHDFHRVHAAAGGHLNETGIAYETLLPAHVRSFVYRLALDRGHHDTVLDRFVVGPLVRLAGWLNRLERIWSAPSVNDKREPGPVAGMAEKMVGGLDG